MNTAIKNFQIMENANGILGIELMAAAQALDFRDYAFGIGVKKAKEVISKGISDALEYFELDINVKVNAYSISSYIFEMLL